jgi:hypothetical protein
MGDLREDLQEKIDEVEELKDAFEAEGSYVDKFKRLSSFQKFVVLAAGLVVVVLLTAGVSMLF